MDLPRLLFGVGFQIFFYSDASNVCSHEYVENVRLNATIASDVYKHCKSHLRTVWQQFG